MTVNAETWTVIATKKNDDSGGLIRWRYEAGYNARNVMVAVDARQLITAHRRVAGGWHLVARLPKT